MTERAEAKLIEILENLRDNNLLIVTRLIRELKEMMEEE